MGSIETLLLSPGATIREAISVIEAGERRTALMVDQRFTLIGIIRDADIRRGLLSGHSLDDPASSIMNAKPILGLDGMNRAALSSLMRRKRLDMVPIVDQSGRLRSVEYQACGPEIEERENDVVLMAGGCGRRLGGLTRDCPKPLLNVGAKPILETIIEAFSEQGFRRFWISVNYLGEMIEAYFGDGRAWDVEINYLREDRPLGTAGALSLLPVAPKRPLVVMNGDILTKVPFGDLLDFHAEMKASATMCIRRHEVTIPYGVVEASDGYLTGIVEKPRQQTFINAGIYVLDPKLIVGLPTDRPSDMPTLLEAELAANGAIALFPIREYWMDIGHLEDFKQANADYWHLFGSRRQARQDPNHDPAREEPPRFEAQVQPFRKSAGSAS